MAGKIGGNWQLLYLSAWKSPGLELNDIGYMQVADQYLGVGGNQLQHLQAFQHIQQYVLSEPT
ncbi:MAG: hypothetical protein MZV63_50195 [Marinilabiliales bacterium]|nr:hypothetical protein [Marinilabiliales bacterium]